MTRLNHPLKRLSFILFLCSGALLVGLALLPSPFEISSYPEWKDAAASEVPDRHVTRINTACAAPRFGGLEVFARDFFIVDAYSSENEYARVITEMGIERGEPFNIASTVDISEKDKAAFLSELSGAKKLCLKGICVEKLDTALFGAVLESCSTSVGQRRDDIHDVKWRIPSNLKDSFPWSLIAFLLSVAFLLLSLAYDRTLGPIIKWVRTGSW